MKSILSELDKYYEEHKKEKILLVSSNETYGEFIAKNKSKLKSKFSLIILALSYNIL